MNVKEILMEEEDKEEEEWMKRIGDGDEGRGGGSYGR